MSNVVLKNACFDAVKYTDSNSVDYIMDIFGTKDINNSPSGLYFKGILIEKETWLIKGTNKKVHIMDDEQFNEFFIEY